MIIDIPRTIDRTYVVVSAIPDHENATNRYVSCAYDSVAAGCVARYLRDGRATSVVVVDVPPHEIVWDEEHGEDVVTDAARAALQIGIEWAERLHKKVGACGWFPLGGAAAATEAGERGIDAGLAPVMLSAARARWAELCVECEEARASFARVAVSGGDRS